MPTVAWPIGSRSLRHSSHAQALDDAVVTREKDEIVADGANGGTEPRDRCLRIDDERSAGSRGNAFNGRVKGVQLAIAVAAENSDHLVSPEDAIRIAMARQ
jgi:hypothetical protein